MNSQEKSTRSTGKVPCRNEASRKPHSQDKVELPVRLLTDLLSTEERKVACKVNQTHDVLYCPVGICLPGESDSSRRMYTSLTDEKISEFRYTPRAYFAVKVWETARDELLATEEFSDALKFEWQPVAASFNSIHYVNGSPDRFVECLFAKMKAIADSQTIDIHYGRVDAPARPELPDYPRRYYIMPPDMLAKNRNHSMDNDLDTLHGKPRKRQTWKDIKDIFVRLKPIQLAYIAGEPMNKHTPLDEKFIDACSSFDYEKVRKLVAKGANIHAVDKYGESAMTAMVYNYGFTGKVDKDGYYIFDDRNFDAFIQISEYLLSLGYNLNLAGYDGCTPLHDTIYVHNLAIPRFLLDHGADPNAPSDIGEIFCGESPLGAAWNEADFCPESKCEELAQLLLKYGARPMVMEEELEGNNLDAWIEEQKQKGMWDCPGCENLSKLDAALVIAARNQFFYRVALLVKKGAKIGLRDALGRNLLQIILEETLPKLTPHEQEPKAFQMDLMEMSLMLLCGFGLTLSAVEMDKAKQTCKQKGYDNVRKAIEDVQRNTHPARNANKCLIEE